MVLISAFMWINPEVKAIAEQTVYPKGTTIDNKNLSYKSDYLFGSSGDTVEHTYFIDMEGNVIHERSCLGFQTKYIDPALIELRQK